MLLMVIPAATEAAQRGQIFGLGGQRSRAGVGAEAYNRGYEDGLRRGEQDARRDRAYDVRRDGAYRDADRGYNRRYGTREAYRDTYRAGYEVGYRDGFRRERTVRVQDTRRDPRVLAPRAGRGYYEPAYARGFDDGFRKGLEDGRDGDRYDPVRHRDYREADQGYSGSYGSRDAYQNNYRSGFRQGYEEGYRDGTRNRR
jgi:flagellar biosynthesis/type III secretory pathway protein FliH